MNIQWYPGHMTKAKRMMSENLNLVDIVVELLDARIPLSSKNPDIDELAKNKHRIILLNKSDLADEKATSKWSEYYSARGFYVIAVNSVSGKGINDIIKLSEELMKEKKERLKKRGRIFVPTRSMICGIPNVGKSTLINKFVGKTLAKTGDKPGVTKGKQWIRIRKDFELLDTPGILWPKFDDKNVGLKLAFTGAVNDNILDTVTLSHNLIGILRKMYPTCLSDRYKIEYTDEDLNDKILEKIAIARGFRLKGDELDFRRTAAILLDEFRGCKLGRLTLELPEE